MPAPARRQPGHDDTSAKEDNMTSEDTEGGGVVVVGVDGSEPSRDALRWAVHYARTTGAIVRAVTVWHFPASFGWGSALAIPEADLEGDARAAPKATERSPGCCSARSASTASTTPTARSSSSATPTTTD